MTDTRVHDRIKKIVELDIDRLTDKQSYPESVLKSTAIIMITKACISYNCGPRLLNT